MIITMMMIIITIIIKLIKKIIIIALKGAIRDFYNLLTARELPPYHVQHTERLPRANMHATWCGGTAQLLSCTEFKSHLFKINLIAETINR